MYVIKKVSEERYLRCMYPRELQRKLQEERKNNPEVTERDINPFKEVATWQHAQPFPEHLIANKICDKLQGYEIVNVIITENQWEVMLYGYRQNFIRTFAAYDEIPRNEHNWDYELYLISEFMERSVDLETILKEWYTSYEERHLWVPYRLTEAIKICTKDMLNFKLHGIPLRYKEEKLRPQTFLECVY